MKEIKRIVSLNNNFKNFNLDNSNLEIDNSNLEFDNSNNLENSNIEDFSPIVLNSIKFLNKIDSQKNINKIQKSENKENSEEMKRKREDFENEEKKIQKEKEKQKIEIVEIEECKNNYIKETEEETKKKVIALKEHSDNQPVQRTFEWFQLRKTRITASDVASCLRKVSTVCKHYMQDYGLEKTFKHSETSFCNPYSNENDFILKKNGHSEFVDNLAVKWGNKYEDAVVSFYERNFDIEVWEFGLLLHKDISWLACSPDGITPLGKMIEIKCPFRRKINGIPPLYYWIQCQIQLEVCDLEDCDYIECNLENLTKEQWEKIPDNTVSITHQPGMGPKREVKDLQVKGLLINIENNYYYPPAKYKTCEQMIRWAEKKCNKYKKLKPQTEYYRITEYSLVSIKRNREWFSVVKPMLEKTWQKVLSFDMKNYKSYLDKKKESKNLEDSEKTLSFKTDKNDVCLLSDDEN